MKSYEWKKPGYKDAPCTLCWSCGTALGEDFYEIVIDGHPRKLHNICVFNHMIDSLTSSEVNSESNWPIPGDDR